MGGDLEVGDSPINISRVNKSVEPSFIRPGSSWRLSSPGVAISLRQAAVDVAAAGALEKRTLADFSVRPTAALPRVADSARPLAGRSQMPIAIRTAWLWIMPSSRTFS